MEAPAPLSSAPLSSALLGALEGTHSSDSDSIAGLERVLESVVRDARAKWPLLSVDAIEFMRHLARGIADDVPVGDAVASLLARSASQTFRAKAQVFEQDNHQSVAFRSLYDGLLFTFEGYK